MGQVLLGTSSIEVRVGDARYLLHGADWAWMLAQVKALPARRFDAAATCWHISPAGLASLQALGALSVDAFDPAAESIDSLLQQVFPVVDGDSPAYAALVARYEAAQAWRDENRSAASDTAKVRAEVKKIVAAIEDLTWSRAQTSSRRAAWNRLAKAGIGWEECQEELGIQMADLKAAITRHGL